VDITAHSRYRRTSRWRSAPFIFSPLLALFSRRRPPLVLLAHNYCTLWSADIAALLLIIEAARRPGRERSQKRLADWEGSARGSGSSIPDPSSPIRTGALREATRRSRRELADQERSAHRSDSLIPTELASRKGALIAIAAVRRTGRERIEATHRSGTERLSKRLADPDGSAHDSGSPTRAGRSTDCLAIRKGALNAVARRPERSKLDSQRRPRRLPPPIAAACQPGTERSWKRFADRTERSSKRFANRKERLQLGRPASSPSTRRQKNRPRRCWLAV